MKKFKKISILLLLLALSIFSLQSTKIMADYDDVDKTPIACPGNN